MVVRSRKGLFGFVLVCAFLVSIASSDRDQSGRVTDARGIPGAGGTTSTSGITVGSSTRDSLSMNVATSGLKMTTDVQLGTSYKRLELDGAVPLGQVGAPDVPVFRRLVAIPKCDSVRISISGQRSSFVEEVSVRPLPRIVSTPSGEETTFARNDEIYASDREFPGSVVRIEQIGFLRGQRIALVGIYPIQFNPVDSQVRVIEGLKIKFEYTNPEGELVADVGPFQNVVSRALLNYDASGGLLPSASMDGLQRTEGTGEVCWCTGNDWESAASSAISCGADYLMIVGAGLNDSALVDSLARRRAHYNGFNVAVARMSQIDSSPDTSTTPITIRDFIKEIYDSESAAHMGDRKLGYVLLLGDAYDSERNIVIPTYYGYLGAGQDDYDNESASDAFYSFLDSDPSSDMLPDVFLGRLPVDYDEEYWELSNVVNKICSYEPLPVEAAWPDKVLMVSGGSDQGFTFSPQGRSGFQSYFDSITTYYVPSNVTTNQLHTLPDRDRIPFGFQVADSVDSGYWLVGLFDHGMTFYLWDAFYPQHYEFLNNQASPSLFFCIGSNTGFFDLTSDKAANWPGGGSCCTAPYDSVSNPGCFSNATSIDRCDALVERLVVQPAGAIGVVAYSRSQATDAAQSDFVNLFRSLFEGAATTLGDVLVGTKLLRANDPVVVRNLTLYGDPALNIRWKEGEEAADVDLVVGKQDIQTGNGISYQNSAESAELRITVRNVWQDHAYNVGMEIWDGAPDSTGSARLDSLGLARVPAYGDTMTSHQIGGLANGFHDIFVRVDPGDSIEEAREDNNVSSIRIQFLPYHGSYPKKLDADGRRSITISDVSSEPGKEILFWSADYRLNCYAADDTVPLWSFSRGAAGHGGTMGFRSSPIVGSVQKDGVEFVVVEADSPSYAYAINGTTGNAADSVLVGDRTFASDEPWEAYVLSDFNVGDETLDLATTVYKPGPFSYDSLYARVVSFEDGIIATTPIDVFQTQGDGYAMAVGDVDHDGSKDLVVSLVSPSAFEPASSNELFVFSYESGSLTEQWRKDLSALNPPTAFVILFDRDGDGTMEILCNGRPSASPYDVVYLYSSSGTKLWDTSIYIPQGDKLFASVGDLDGDGTYEIVLLSDEKMRVLSAATGSIEREETMTGDPTTAPLLVDLGGGADLEIITVYRERDPNIYFPPTNKFIERLQVWDDQLALADSYVFTGTALSTSRPAVADIDGDGVFELTYVGPDKFLHVLELGTEAGRAAWPQRFRDTMHTSVVEQPLIGTYSTDVALFNDIRVLGDVTIDSALYVDTSARLRVSLSDTTHGGQDTTRCEFTIKGPAKVIGSAASPVTFLGSSSGFSDSAWVGLVVDAACDSARFRYTTIQNALTGIENHAPIELEHCSILDCRTGISGASRVVGAGCRIDAAMGISTTADMELTESSVAGAYYALDVGGGIIQMEVDTLSVSLATGTALLVEGLDDSLVCDGCRIEGGSYGISIETNDGEVRVRNSRVGNADIAGVYLPDSCTATIEGCTITGNDVGVEIYRNSNVVIKNSTIDENETDGIYCHVNSGIEIQGNDITNNTLGIYCLDWSDAVISDGNEIAYNTGGIKCEDHANAVIRENKITNNGVGVAALDDAEPDLGLGACGEDSCTTEPCPDHGGNSIYSNSSYDVSNLTESGTVWAICNYWGTRGPLPSKFYGLVEYAPYLHGDPWPALSAPQDREEEQALPHRYSVSQNYPNPFNPSTTIAYDIPPPGAEVEILIYDVAGRLLRVLVSEPKLAGRYTITWDGKDSRGQAVASGVYFLRMSAGEFRATRKLLILK